MSNNSIIDIWIENNRNLPIKVARKNWKTKGYAKVISITEIGSRKRNNVIKKRYEVLAETYNGAENIGSNFALKEDGLYVVKLYDYKNWYLIHED